MPFAYHPLVNFQLADSKPLTYSTRKTELNRHIFKMCFKAEMLIQRILVSHDSTCFDSELDYKSRSYKMAQFESPYHKDHAWQIFQTRPVPTRQIPQQQYILKDFKPIVGQQNA